MLASVPCRAAMFAGLFGLSVGAATGCGNFFEELQSADSTDPADSDAGSGDSDAGSGEIILPDGECAFPEDGECKDQDTVQRCDPDSGEIELFSCLAICGQNTNFACVMVSPGEHGCWCVETGQQKVFSCSELEACLVDCTSAATGACADQCFSRTDTGTVRLYGALVNCAHDGCRDTCNEAPEFCASCVETTIITGAGACGLARSVCDSDENDDLGPFG